MRIGSTFKNLTRAGVLTVASAFPSAGNAEENIRAEIPQTISQAVDKQNKQDLRIESLENQIANLKNDIEKLQKDKRSLYIHNLIPLVAYVTVISCIALIYTRRNNKIASTIFEKLQKLESNISEELQKIYSSMKNTPEAKEKKEFFISAFSHNLIFKLNNKKPEPIGGAVLLFKDSNDLEEFLLQSNLDKGEGLAQYVSQELIEKIISKFKKTHLELTDIKVQFDHVKDAPKLSSYSISYKVENENEQSAIFNLELFLRKNDVYETLLDKIRENIRLISQVFSDTEHSLQEEQIFVYTKEIDTVKTLIELIKLSKQKVGSNEINKKLNIDFSEDILDMFREYIDEEKIDENKFEELLKRENAELEKWKKEKVES